MSHCHPSGGWSAAVRLLIVLFVSANAAQGQTTLQEVLVTASRPLAPTEQRIDSTLIHSLNAHSVADVLRYANGVQIKDYGGVGGLKTVNIRGMGTEHTAIVYDGVHVVSAQNGQVDLGRFATDNLHAVSLMDLSNLFSASESALATTVAFETARPQSKLTRIKLKAGSFDTYDASLLCNWKLLPSGRQGGGFNSLSAQAVVTSGRFRFHVAKKNGYDTLMTRHNGDVKSFRIEDNLWLGRTQMKFYGYYSRRGLPGAVVREEPGRFRHQDRQSDMDIFVQGKTQFNAGPLRMAVKWKADWNRLHYLSDPRLDVTTMYIDNTYRQTELYASCMASYHSSPRAGRVGEWHLSAAVDLRHNYLDANLTDFVYPHRLGIFANAIAQYSFCDFSARAMALVQGFEDWTHPPLHSTPPLGEADSQLSTLNSQLSILNSQLSTLNSQLSTLNSQLSTLNSQLSTLNGRGLSHKSLWRFTPAITLTQRLGPLTIDGIYKHTVRQPTFNDLYYTFIGNTRLQPEELRQLMLALSLNWPKILHLTVKPYLNWTTNKIVAVPTSNQFRWTMMNLGRVETVGVSLSAETAFKLDRVGLTLRATYDWTQARDFTDRSSTGYGGQIPYIPWHAASFVGCLSWRNFTLNASFLYTGERYESSANIPENYTKPWYTTDLALRWQHRRLALALELNNLFNQQYEVVQCYPMPGTNFKAILTMDL